MDSQQGCIVTHNYNQEPSGVVGKFVVAPTATAEKIWEAFRNNPLAFTFQVGYITDENGQHQLMELSLVEKYGNEPNTVS